MILEVKVGDTVVKYQGGSEGIYRIIGTTPSGLSILKKIADLQGSSVKDDRCSFKLDTMYFMTLPQYKKYVNDNLDKLMETLGKVGDK